MGSIILCEKNFEKTAFMIPEQWCTKNTKYGWNVQWLCYTFPLHTEDPPEEHPEADVQYVCYKETQGGLRQ